MLALLISHSFMALGDHKNLCLFFWLSHSVNRSCRSETVDTLTESTFSVVCHFPHSISFLQHVKQYKHGLVRSLDWLMAVSCFRTGRHPATTGHDWCILDWIVRIQAALILEHCTLPVTNLEHISGWVGTQ